ncbi:mercury resistance system periplasmic binding protein MerP [Sneathiella aquimaris]|uniref:mercury resistance system periplasmic binding protein MerP n=1 Tax=Sneathiella aquimaris TaxID=2599305 RepID=UPI00146B587F|nr:mercury resistance system periplasmic binding protein MerP [Sneathiella aquimaris]MBO6827355.1 mercury resistance system periplasmic binding protein MerP [Sneathiella sp.]
MKTVIVVGVAVLSLLPFNMSFAAEQKVTLEVSGMTCASCPYIVKNTLASVDGVKNVNVSFKKKQAVVTFDDQETQTTTLTKATASAGFPSKVME